MVHYVPLDNVFVKQICEFWVESKKNLVFARKSRMQTIAHKLCAHKPKNIAQSCCVHFLMLQLLNMSA